VKLNSLNKQAIWWFCLHNHYQRNHS